MDVPVWIENLRRREIVDRLRADPRVGPLLNDTSVMFDSVIEGGQADFDVPWGQLEGEDRARCYAYLNQKGHIEELSAAFQMLFSNESEFHDPVVIDVGCGPCTGGIALSGVLGSDEPFTYIGIDRAASMRSLGEALVQSAASEGHMRAVTTHWYDGVPRVEWDRPPGWRPVIVIVSYLLASPTVDAGQLVGELTGLVERVGRGPTTVLYTNSTRAGPNRSFPSFRDSLLAADFDLVADDEGEISVTRGWEQKKRPLRYALFQRQRQRVLEV